MESLDQRSPEDRELKRVEEEEGVVVGVAVERRPAEAAAAVVVAEIRASCRRVDGKWVWSIHHDDNRCHHDGNRCHHHDIHYGIHDEMSNGAHHFRLLAMKD